MPCFWNEKEEDFSGQGIRGHLGPNGVQGKSPDGGLGVEAPEAPGFSAF